MMLNRETSRVILVDVQERLFPHMFGKESLARSCDRLLHGARLCDVPLLICEQSPEKIGTTIAPLLPHLKGHKVFTKTAFSAYSDPSFRERLEADKHRRQLVLCGIETHVCVLQTALQCQEAGYEVFVVQEACSSRTENNRACAFQRLIQEGVRVASLEMVLFEWVRASGTDTFRELSSLIK